MSIKEVRFDQYCPSCVHYQKSEAEDPCYECLDQGWNDDSRKPINYKENTRGLNKPLNESNRKR